MWAGGVLYPFKKYGKKVTGGDFNQEYLEFGKSQNLDLRYGNIFNNINFKADLIICSHVLEHEINPKKLLLNIIENTNNGGYILCEVPGTFSIHNFFNKNLLNHFQNAHVYNYSHYHLQCMFKILGLKILFINPKATIIPQKPIDYDINNYINAKLINSSQLNITILKY